MSFSLHRKLYEFICKEGNTKLIASVASSPACSPSTSALVPFSQLAALPLASSYVFNFLQRNQHPLLTFDIIQPHLLAFTGAFILFLSGAASLTAELSGTNCGHVNWSNCNLSKGLEVIAWSTYFLFWFIQWPHRHRKIHMTLFAISQSAPSSSLLLFSSSSPSASRQDPVPACVEAPLSQHRLRRSRDSPGPPHS